MEIELSRDLILMISKIFFAAVGTVLFLQSGFDKISDRKGNLEWLTGHFSKSILNGYIPILLSIITFLEVISGFLCVIAIAGLLFNKVIFTYPMAMMLCLASLLCLFTGQRLAKDYAGAASLMPYFLVFAFGLILSLV